MAYINPLDLEQLFINTFAGGTGIFVFLVLIFLAGLAASFRMSNTNVLLMLGLFVVMMTPIIAGVQGIFMLIVLIAGIIIALALNRIVR